MPNSNVKIVYSLRIHIALQQQGFTFMTEMKNPHNPKLNCWVYAATPDFLAAFDALIGEVAAND
jgi:hypothetical protein